MRFGIVILRVQRLCVHRVKTRKIKDDVTSQSEVRYYYDAAVRVTSSQSDRRWKAFQQYDGIADAVLRYGTQYPYGDKNLLNEIEYTFH